MIPKLSAVITLDPWLTFLAQWLSPRQVTHVGANLLSIDQSILNGVELLVIDADPAKIDQVQRQLPGRHFQFFPHIVAERTGPIVWYQASNSAESGLLAIDQLQRYWQNIKTVEVQPKHAFALDDVYATLATQPCWLWVDCFPALFILQGARNALAQANVVLSRVDIAQAGAPAECSLAAVQAFMQTQGYVLAGVQPERHPSIGSAIFFRNFAQLVEEAQTALTAANLAKDAMEKHAEALAKQAHDALGKIAKLEEEHTRLLAEHDAEAHAKATVLAAKNVEIESQQQLLQQELYRAEVQIELIKDLLLREPGL